MSHNIVWRKSWLSKEYLINTEFYAESENHSLDSQLLAWRELG